nr:helix-turn-helix domain-containing protein [Streptomyces sp. LUP30]
MKFAADLRELRKAAGSPSYRELSEKAHFSRASLSAAASGHRLPTWEVTRAYVTVCGGDIDEWLHRWKAVRSELGLEPAESAGKNAPVSEIVTDSPQAVSRAKGEGSWTWLGRSFWALAISLAALLVSVSLPYVTSSSKSNQVEGDEVKPTARYLESPEPVLDNADPKRAGCADDPVGVKTLDSVQLNTSLRQLLGIVELRHSPTCGADWGRFTPSERMTYVHSEYEITITARRPSTRTVGAPFVVTFDGQAAYGNILLERSGCIEITVEIVSKMGGGTATTACKV